MSLPPMSMPLRAMSGAAAGPGIRAQPAGCTALASRAFSAFISRVASCVLTPAFPSRPCFEIILRRGASRYEIVVEKLQSVQRGVATAELNGAKIAARPLSIPLKDDGAIHRLLVRLG